MSIYRLIPNFLFFFVCLSMSHLYTQNTFDWSDIQATAKNAVVYIGAQVAEVDILQPQKEPKLSFRDGAGFIVNERGDIVVSFSLIDQARSILVEFPEMENESFYADVVVIDPQRDLALLRLQPYALEQIFKKYGTIPSLPLGDSKMVHRGDEIVTITCNCIGHEMRHFIIQGREAAYLVVKGSASRGGPSVNKFGQVIGLYAARIIGEDIGYLIASNDIRAMLYELSML